MKIKTNIKHWWKMLTKENRSSPTVKKRLFQYHFFLHKSYMERTGLPPDPPREEAGD
jgi:hypothetical protein